MIGRFSWKKSIVFSLLFFCCFLMNGYTEKYLIELENDSINFFIDQEGANEKIYFESFKSPSKYVAYFISDSGVYYLWDGNKWSSLDSTKSDQKLKISALQKLYLDAFNKSGVGKDYSNTFKRENSLQKDDYIFDFEFSKIVINSEYEEKYIDDKGIGNTKNYNDLYIYNGTKGKFVLFINAGSNYFAIKFSKKDIESLASIISSSADKSTKINEVEACIDNVISGNTSGMSAEKLQSTKDILYKLYLSFDSMEPYDNNGGRNVFEGDIILPRNIYEDTSIESILYRYYLEKAYNVSMPLLGSLYGTKPYYNYKSFSNINEEQGKNLAQLALRYLCYGAEYGSPKKDDEKSKYIYKENKGIFTELDFSQIGIKDGAVDSKVNGYPIPYCENGIDSPEVFWNKMKSQEKNGSTLKGSGAFSNYKSDEFHYVPGDGKSLYNNGAGCDGWGLLTGILYESEILNKSNFTIGTSNNNKTIDSLFSSYLNFKKDYIKDSKNNSFKKNQQKIDELRINEVKLKSFTCIVPEISMIHLGDIIEFKQNNDNQVAIVVKVNTSPSKMSDVYVVYMDKKEGCAKLSTWDKIVTTDNPFTLVRRLCVGGSEKNADAYNFDLFDLTAQDYDISIGFMREETQVSPERYRWIPNTGEYLVLSKIQLNCYNRLGIPVPLGYDKYVVLNGAVDRDYNANDTNGNLYNNRASNFDVKIFSSSNEKFSGLMKKSSSDEKSYVIVEDAAKSNYIEIDQNGFLEDAAKPNYIKIDQNGYLVDASSKKLISIGIRPENAANAFPGDDLRLDFSVCKYIGGSLFATLKESLLTKETDYIAVYDKKMLWRANLYIDKKEESLGGIDWNDGHPWNAPASSNTTTGTWGDTANPQITLASWNGNDWGYNEWWNDENSENYAGGQQPIVGWTRWNDNFTVLNSVVYGYGCKQEFSDFNNYMKDQRNCIINKRNFNNQNNAYFLLTGNTYNGTELQVSAPNDKWEQYVFNKNYVTSVVGTTTKKIKNKDSEPENNITGIDYIFTESNVRVPGLSTYFKYDEDISYYKAAQVNGSIGVDCSGFASVSKMWTNQNSELVNGAEYGTTSLLDCCIVIYDDEWNFTDPDCTEERKKLEQKLISHAVPGDLLNYPGYHVAIVQNIEAVDGLISNYNQLYVIHCGSGQKYEWCVLKGDWSSLDYAGHKPNVFGLYRFKIKNSQN